MEFMKHRLLGSSGTFENVAVTVEDFLKRGLKELEFQRCVQNEH